VTEPVNPLDEAAHAAAYRGVRERVTELVRAAPPEALAAIAPATPQWRARDVFAHIVGVATDIVNGNVADAAADHWTAAQVEARYDTPIAELIDEWAENGTKVDAFILALPTVVTGQLVADAVTHEHDLRQAFGQPGARDSHALTIAVNWVIGALGRVYDDAGTPATRFESEAVAAIAGTGALDTTVRASTFELGRAIAGRRTVAEVAAYEWTPEPRPDRVLALPLFRPPAQSLGE
jgi:Mycothiol maleylpyruvate isomerase N-terminal domain